MDYKEYNDNELIYTINECEESEEILYKKYKKLIMKLANKFYNKYKYIGLELNDFILEGMFSFDRAIKTYDMDNSASFFTYVYRCIYNNLYVLVRKNKSKRNDILNNTLDLETSERMGLIKNNYFDDYNKIEDSIFNLEFINNLKGIEKEVILCKLLGLTNKEISSILNIDTRQINAAFMRVKYKLKKQ